MKVLYRLGVAAGLLCAASAAQAATVSIDSAVSDALTTCEISVSGAAVSSGGVPATAVSLYLVAPSGQHTALVINHSLGAGGAYAWHGSVTVEAPSFQGYSVIAYTNRQANATKPLSGQCTG